MGSIVQYPVPGRIANNAPTDIALSNASVLDNASSGATVGTLSATDSDDSSWSWAITNGNTKFQLSASSGSTVTLQRSATGTITAGVNETVTVQVTDSGSNTYSESFTITIGDHTATTDVTTMTVTDTSGGAQTNVPVEFGVPLAAATLSSGDILEVYDGATLLLTQEDNRASDFNSKVRFSKLSCILPSLGASASKTLTVKKRNASAATGTAITASDITATTYDALVTIVAGGTTYTAAARDGLAAAATWSTTGAVNHGTWRSGPLCTEFVVSAPLKTGGGTAHNSLRAWFHVAAFKASSAAVSGGNPITGIRTDCIIENQAYLQGAAADAIDIGYDFLLQKDTTPSTVVAWANAATPSDGLTVTGFPSVSGKSAITYTRGTGSFNSNDPGRAIVDPSGNGFSTVVAISAGAATCILTYAAAMLGKAISSTDTTADTVTTASAHGITTGQQAYMVTSAKPPSFGSAPGGTSSLTLYYARAVSTTVLAFYSTQTDANNDTNRINLTSAAANCKVCPATISSSSWLLTGVGHAYGARWRQRFWWGTAPAVTVAPVAADVIASYAVNNYTTASGSITHDMTKINAMGTRPFAATLSSGTSGDPYVNDVLCYMPNTGNRPDIGVLPGWHVEGLIKYDSNGVKKVFNNAEGWVTIPNKFRSSATGLPARLDTGTNWVFDPRFGGTLVRTPDDVNGMNTPWSFQPAHHPQVLLVPYILTGDLVWMEELQFLSASLSTYDPTYNGSGLNRTSWKAEEMRGMAWNARSVGDCAVMTPDSAPSGILGWNKTHVSTWLQNWYSWAVSTGWVFDTAPTTTTTTARFVTPGPRWTACGDNSEFGSGGEYATGQQYAPWMHHYFVQVMWHLKELGALDSNGQSVLDWLAPPITDIITSGSANTSDVATDFWAGDYYIVVYDNATKYKTFAQVYGMQVRQRTYTNQRLWKRATPVTATLSATSGTAVTVTFSANIFANGLTFYDNGYVVTYSDTNAGNITGRGKIVAGSETANSCQVDTTAGGCFGFSSTSPTYTAVPVPHPGDAEAPASYPWIDAHYGGLFLSCAELLKGYYTNANVARTYASNRAGYSLDTNITWANR